MKLDAPSTNIHSALKQVEQTEELQQIKNKCKNAPFIQHN